MKNMMYSYYSNHYKKYVIGKIIKSYKMYQGGVQFVIQHKRQQTTKSAALNTWNNIILPNITVDIKGQILQWYKNEILRVHDSGSEKFDKVCIRYLRRYFPEELL